MDSSSSSIYANQPWKKNYAPHVPDKLDDLPYQNLAELIAHVSQNSPDKPAYTICLPNGFAATLTYEQVDELSYHFALHLKHNLHLKKGDKVAIQLPNCLDYPIAAFGILRAGLTLVNVNPLYTEQEMLHQLNDSECKAIIILDMFSDKLERIINSTQIKHVFVASIADYFSYALKHVIQLKLKYLDKVIPNVNRDFTPFVLGVEHGRKHAKKFLFIPIKSARKEPLEKIGLDDIACLQYTGGTTGVSKGAVLTHKNILSNIYQIITYAGPLFKDGEECVITALPLYHIFSFTVNMFCFYAKSAHNILIPNPRPITNLRKGFQNYKITWITGVNTLFNALTEEKWYQENPPKDLKLAVAGGMALLSGTVFKWQKITPTPLIEGYGLTESSPVLTFNPIGGTIVKQDSIGVPLPGTEMKLVDDKGNEVPLGTPGEILARGPQVMLGYWKQPEETANVLNSEGWLATGDIAIMDKEGFFKIVDRKKDMILVSGFNVYPNEIEDCLQCMPDILEAAVIGVQGEDKSELVKAFVVKKNPNVTEDEIKAHCKSMLTSYKVPKLIEFRDELPKSNVGKILRKELKKYEAEKRKNK